LAAVAERLLPGAGTAVFVLTLSVISDPAASGAGGGGLPVRVQVVL